MSDRNKITNRNIGLTLTPAGAYSSILISILYVTLLHYLRITNLTVTILPVIVTFFLHSIIWRRKHLREWWYILKQYRTKNRVWKINPSNVFENNWFIVDKDTVSIFLELTPPIYSWVKLGDTNTQPSLPLPTIFQYIDQYGLDLKNIRIINTGYKFAVNKPYKREMQHQIGSFPGLTHQQHVIQLILSIPDSEVNARKRTIRIGRTPVKYTGILKTLEIACKRLRNNLLETGYQCHVMSQKEIYKFSNQILTEISEHTGKTNSYSINKRVFTYAAPIPGFMNKQLSQWLTVDADRMYTCFTISKDREGFYHLDAQITFLMSGEYFDTVAESQGLKKLPFEQNQAVTKLIPLISTIETSESYDLVSTKPSPKNVHYPFGGCGVFLGEGTGGSKFFINITSGRLIRPFLYMSVPDLYVQQFIARLTIMGVTVSIISDNPLWEKFINKHNDSMILLNPSSVEQAKTQVVVTNKPFDPKKRVRGQTVIMLVQSVKNRSNIIFQQTNKTDDTVFAYIPLNSGSGYGFRWVKPSPTEIKEFLVNTTI